MSQVELVVLTVAPHCPQRAKYYARDGPGPGIYTSLLRPTKRVKALRPPFP